MRNQAGLVDQLFNLTGRNIHQFVNFLAQGGNQKVGFHYAIQKGFDFPPRYRTAPDHKDFLTRLPLMIQVDGLNIVHATVHSPELFGYIESSLAARLSFEALGASIVLPCDVSEDGQLEAVFAAAGERWGRLDFALHSIAYAPKADLHGRLADCSRSGFLEAMDVSCHSFIRMARCAEPLMTGGGALLTMTYYGAEKVIEPNNILENKRN